MIRRSTQDLEVLVVEDDEDLAHALCMVLQEDGHRAHWRRNGQEALEFLRQATELPDAIVLDLRMPVMNGWEFRIEQRKDPTLAQLPVVAISADSSPQARTINTEAVLPKPISASELLLTLRTVVERARASALSQQEQLIALGQLAAGVAHEINNPLSYIIGNLRLLQDAVSGGTSGDPLPPQEVKQILQETEEGALRIAQIVRDMQVFSSIRDEAPEVTDLRAILESVLNMAATALRRRAQVVRDFDGPVYTKAPPARLAQLFLHLVLNAADAMSEGDPPPHTLTLRLRREGDWSVAVISDDGRGISPALLERIFEPFFSTKSSRGSGLGLYVCRSIVQQLQGELRVESSPGTGSTFRIELPAAERPS